MINDGAVRAIFPKEVLDGGYIEPQPLVSGL